MKKQIGRTRHKKLTITPGPHRLDSDRNRLTSVIIIEAPVSVVEIAEKATERYSGEKPRERLARKPQKSNADVFDVYVEP